MVLRRDDVAPIGRAATGSLLWTTRGRLHLTVIVKATYNFRLGGIMSTTEPLPLTVEDVHHGGLPSRSVRRATDLAPYLRHADIVFTGQAHAPPGKTVGVATVRLAVHGERPLLDKHLEIYGDRKLRRDGVSAPLPFKRMPIVYGRAVGEALPDGALLAVHGGAAGALANIVDPAQPEQCAGFGPLARAGREHRYGLSSEVKRLLGLPITEIPSSFDWSYFQVAPLDQRTRFQRGNEWVHLEGLDPAQPRVRTQLPSAQGAAWVWPRQTPGESGWALPLHADTLSIDGDRGRCTVTWRGCFPVASEGVVASLQILAGVQTPKERIDWPAEIATVEQAAADAAMAAPASPVIVDLFGTVNEVNLGVQPTVMGPATKADEAPDDADATSGDEIRMPAMPAPPGDPLLSTVVMNPPGEPTPPDGAKTGEPPLDPLSMTLLIGSAPDEAAAPAPSGAVQDPLASTIGTTFLPDTPATPFDDSTEAPAPAKTATSDPLASTIGTSLVSQEPITPWANQPRPADRRPPREGPPVAATPWDEPTSTGEQEPAVADEPAAVDTPVPAAPPLLPSMRDTPFVALKEGEPLPLPLPAQPEALFGTVAVSDLTPTSAGAPFPLAGSAGSPPTLHPAAFPGAPWSEEQAAPVVAPTTDPLASTLGVSDVLSPSAADELTARQPCGLGAEFLAAFDAIG
ncbi:MAG: DUF2169 domain-containing protein [Deltaproteobacteria bacterium]|nr:DUF2169 domain-containing protein [Deltaproteobacteria bacterium]